jgi:hypothetical protein
MKTINTPKQRQATVVYSTSKDKVITKEQAKQIVSEIKAMLKRPDIKRIAKVEFKDRRSYNNYNINFNGLNKKDFETFTFYTEYKNTAAQELAEAIADKKNVYNKLTRVVHLDGTLEECRCWTQENPYTKAVIEALDIIQKITNKALKIEWS